MDQEEKNVFLVLKNCRKPEKKPRKKSEQSQVQSSVKTRSMLKSNSFHMEQKSQIALSNEEDLREDRVQEGQLFRNQEQEVENGEAFEQNQNQMISETQIFDVLVEDMFERQREEEP